MDVSEHLTKTAMRFGLMLALVGMFSMTAYAVASRTREIGIRMALGARADQVMKTILGDAAAPILGGMAAGALGSVFATRLISKFLYNTKASDRASFVVVAVTLVLVGCAAAWIPARRAAHIDPTIALRTE